MNKTVVSYLDGALAALNVARSYLDPDALPLIYLIEERAVKFEGCIGESNCEFDVFIDLTCEAAGIVNTWLEENPGMVLAEDNTGRWVCIDAA